MESKSMKKYLVLTTGEIWTEEEIEQAYNQFKEEMKYNSYDEYMDHMIQLGKYREGGFIEV